MNAKRLALAPLWLCAAMLLPSCDMDLAPEDTLSPSTYFQNGSQLQLWTNRFYTLFPTAEELASQSADDNIRSELGEVLMGQRSAASETGWTWERLRDINYCLQHSHQCADDDARRQYDGVCYFFRAYFYFSKVQRYGDVPWYNQVLNSNDDELLRQPRQDREIIMDSVLQDLDKAIEMLPAGKDQARVTRWAALALKSRAALFEGTFRKYRGMGNWEKYLRQSAAAAETFIDQGGYALWTTGEEPYRTLFNSIDAVSDEIVLARKYADAAQVRHSIPFNIIQFRQGFTRRFMNHYLLANGSRFDSLPNWQTMGYSEETKDRDPRMAQTVLCPGYVQVGATEATADSTSALTGYKPIKYVNAAEYDGALKAYTDYPLFRAAEVYLNFAEAKAELGTLTQADLEKSVTKIRERAKMPKLDMATANQNVSQLLLGYYPNVATGANRGVILEIRRERTVELAMEGFRLWDIFRWKEGQQLTQPFLGIGNVRALPTISVSWDETRDYLWPIPASERVLTGGALTQNPGWTDSTNFD